MGAMTGTTGTTTEHEGRAVHRPGLSVRVRITATVALLVTLALAGAGAIVYLVELRRIDAAIVREAEQELDEFAALQESESVDPGTGEPFRVESILRAFLQRNVPDDDELLIGWLADGRRLLSPEDDPVADEPAFLEAAEPLVAAGGSTRVDTDQGEVRITAQPVQQGGTAGALVVVSYLEPDRSELDDTMRTYGTVAALSLLVIVGAAWWQAGRLLRPLRSLRRTAEEISASDLSRRVPETGNDDITALTRTVNGMLDRLDAAFTAQRQFLDDAGHELKTPLTVLRGHLELVDLTDPQEVAETRALLVDEVDRMARLVGDLILLAKSGRPDFLSLGPADPTDLAASVLSKARALGDRRWVLDSAAAAEPALLVLDEQRITQALLQLADNAVKHTTTGQEVGIGCEVAGGRVRWWVRDTGPGVAAGDRERIFERFERAEVRPGDEGFGLGLSIVAAIARAHGGTAYAAATDRGARFVLDLPAVRRDLPVPVDAADLEATQEVPWPGS